MEYCVQTTDLNQKLVAEKFPLKNGEVAIPDKPGLGIELDEAVLKQYAVQH
jgi:L-alanine-DL-glutamate epimerase-like enolase superfamily enzyme